MQCNKSHFGKPYQDTLTRLLGNSKKTKTNSLWIVLNYAMWNSLIFYHWYLIPYSVSGFLECAHESAQPRSGAALSLTKRIAASENEIAQKGLLGTPGDSWGRGYLWYWERAHSLVSAIFGLILAPRATRLYFYHFIKYLVPQRTLGKQRKDIYFEIKARSKCFEITLIARAYIVT